MKKIEVVHELISHFLEGKQSGRSYPQLVAHFGNPQVTATLIRRSKIRNRPIMFKILSIFAWSMLAVVSIYLAILSYFHMGKPQPTTDFLVEFNQLHRDVDDEDKAWPIYRPLWIKYGFSEGGKFGTNELWHPEGDNRFSRLVKPADPGWAVAIAKLEEISDLLDAFREGAKKKRLGLELQSDISKYSDEDFLALFPNRERGDNSTRWYNMENVDDEVLELFHGSIVSVLLPHIQRLRTAARLFQVDTRWAVEQNDSDRAVENIETVLGLAAQASDSNTLVGSLVGIAVGTIGFNQLEEVLTENPDFFNQVQLAQLQTGIENISIRKWIKVEGERAFLHDIIQRVYTDNGNGDGRMTPLGVKLLSQMSHGIRDQILKTGNKELDLYIAVAENFVAPATLFLVASRRETTEKCDQFIDAYKADFDKPRWLAEHPDFDKFFSENEMRFKVLAMMLPAFGAVRNAMDRTMGRQEGVIAALASQRYYLEHNQWPESLDQLAPEFITELPVDQITGNLIKLLTDENGIVFYSVGNDQDDDGGKLVVDQFGNEKSASSFVVGSANNGDNGDWILWPQAAR